MIKVITGLLLLPAIVVLVLLMACSSNGYKGPASDHFDGKYFFNQEPTKDKTLKDVLRWRLNRKEAGPWQQLELNPEPIGLPASYPKGVLATFINHATVLVQIDGINILTDPVWSERVSPVSFIGPRRYHPPAVSIEALPPIDAVVISHNHYDHMDLATLKKLEQHSSPLFIVGLGNKELLEREKLTRIVELDWWQALNLNDTVTVTGTPAQHWSTRTRLDRNKTLWLGYLIKSNQHSVFFAGDTGMGPHFGQIKERYGAIDLSLLPIGAYLPRWFMKDNHLSPDDALQAHHLLGSKKSMAIHFGTFNLGDDGQFSGAERLRYLLSEPDNKETLFMVPSPGGQIRVSTASRSD